MVVLDKLNRRALLGRGAVAAFSGVAIGATAAAAISEAAPDPDSVFAAIARHKSAWEAFGETINLVDGVVASKEGRTVTAADEARHEAASNAERDTHYEAFATPPTTIAGVRALVEHAVAMGGDFLDPDTWELLSQTLLVSPALGGEGYEPDDEEEGDADA